MNDNVKIVYEIWLNEILNGIWEDRKVDDSLKILDGNKVVKVGWARMKKIQEALYNTTSNIFSKMV